MLSLSQFRKHVFSLFTIMSKTGQTFEVAYKGTVYDLEVRRTNKVPNLTRAKHREVHEVIAINTEECEKCGSLKFNGICMNTKCESNH